MLQLERESSGDAPDDNPGATVIWFGKYEGKRLDELDMGYRLKLVEYAAETPAPNLVHFRDLHQKLVAWTNERAEPGATIMWFGMHRGDRLDQLEEEYCRKLVHFSRENPSTNLVAFRELYTRYLDWLDERRNPLFTQIWFGEFTGFEIWYFYVSQIRWRWLFDRCGEWRDDLIDIQRRYVAWEAKHPEKCCDLPARAPRKAVDIVDVKPSLRDGDANCAPQARREVASRVGKELNLQDDEVPYARRRGRGPDRAPRVILNPVGKRLGLQDDGVASDADESYDSDDGFVVPDDYESTETEDPDDDTEDPLESGDEGYGLTLDQLLADLREEKAAADQNYREVSQSLSLGQPRDNSVAKDIDDPLTQAASGDEGESHNPSEDTDDSLPSLGDIFKTPSASKSSPSKRRLVTRSQANRSSQPFNTDDSDTAVEEIAAPALRRNTASRSPLKRRRPTVVLSDSSSDSDVPLISPSKKRRLQQRRQRRISSPSPFVDVDGDSEDDMPIISPHKNRRGRR
ncbi:hypothetical protein SLS62_009859 [Diatrype stigma]|uniref:Uncharacterized protein n=1 Tax=Diatrype stigma TaxID=117547 RepID=A0AAN9UBP7_9PEZI